MNEGEEEHGLEGGRRLPSFHLSEEHRHRSYDIEDERWATRKQLRDWLIVAAIIVLTLAFSVSIAFFEPGLGSLGR